MKVTKIYTASGDWYAVYVDGVLSQEGHSVRVDDLVTAMGAEYESVEIADDYAECLGFDQSLEVTMRSVNKEVDLPDWCTE